MAEAQASLLARDVSNTRMRRHYAFSCHVTLPHFAIAAAIFHVAYFIADAFAPRRHLLSIAACAVAAGKIP